MASIRRSLLLSYLDKYSTLLIGIITNLVLSRLLTPSDVGVFTIAASLVGLAGPLRDFGVGSYLIQEKELTVARQRTAMGIAMVFTWPIGLLLAALSGVIADFYQNSGIRSVILTLSLNFFFIPFTMVTVMLLRREMQFGGLYRIGLAASLSRSVTGIGLALLGFGFMAMAWSSVAGMVAIFLMSQVELPAAGRLLPSLREWRRIISFGALNTFGQVLGEAGTAAPNVLIGHIMSPTAVGFYSRAFGMTSLFSQAILEGLAPVALATVAVRHREGRNVSGLMIQGLTRITAFGWPFFSFTAILTFPVMRILFGGQWDDAVPLARLISIAAMIGLLDSMTWAVLQGTGSVARYAILQAFTVPVQISVLSVALVYGKSLEAVGWASITGTLIHVVASLVYLRQLVGLQIVELMRAVTKSALLAVFCSIIPAVVSSSMTIGPSNIWPPLLLGAAGAGVGFLGGVFLLSHPLADDIRDAITQGRAIFFRG